MSNRSITLCGETFIASDDVNNETVAITGEDGILLGYARRCMMSDEIDITALLPCGESDGYRLTLVAEDGETSESIEERIIETLLETTESWRITMAPMRISRHVWITLGHGDSYEMSEGGPTDEGYDWCGTTYRREGSVITLDSARDARDCDGRLQEHHTMYCRINGPLNEYGYPIWVRESSEITDHSAIAAGY